MDLTRKPDPMQTTEAHFLRRCPSPALVADPSSTLAEIFATCSYETMCALSVARLTSRANNVPDAYAFSDGSVLVEGQTFPDVGEAEFFFSTEFAFAGEIK